MMTVTAGLATFPPQQLQREGVRPPRPGPWDRNQPMVAVVAQPVRTGEREERLAHPEPRGSGRAMADTMSCSGSVIKHRSDGDRAERERYQ